MADLLVGAVGQARLVDLERRELLLQHPQDLDVDDELLVAADQPGLQPAGGVHDEVGAGQERRQHRHQRLVGRLGVDRLAGRETAAGAPRQAELARDLAGAEQAERRLGGAEARASRTAGRCWTGTSRSTTGQPGRTSWASAIPASASAICCTSAAGTVTGDIAPISRNGVITTGWPAAHVLEHRRQHPVVVAQRRVDVDQRDRHRLALDRLAPAEQDLAHADRVRGVRRRR